MARPADTAAERAPIEVVDLPRPSWKPPLVALGLMGILAATFMGWIFAAAGAALALPALVGWLRDSRDQLDALPLDQATATAVIAPLGDSEAAASVPARRARRAATRRKS